VRNGQRECRNGRCVLVCRAGFGTCNRRGQDGCETNLRTTVRHCGRCGNDCRPLGFSQCVAGTCLGVFDEVGTTFVFAPSAGTLSVDIRGAQGGAGGQGATGSGGAGGAGGNGGLGGRVLATFAVVAGERFQINVGGAGGGAFDGSGEDGGPAGTGGLGNGNNAGLTGANGLSATAGTGQAAGGGGGGGGGGSDVRRAPFQPTDRIVVAGGGGGGGGGTGGVNTAGSLRGGSGAPGGPLPFGNLGGGTSGAPGGDGEDGNGGDGDGPPGFVLEVGAQAGNGRVVIAFTPN
jgi:hypothetical protein